MERERAGGGFGSAAFAKLKLHTDDGVTLAARAWNGSDRRNVTAIVAHGFTGNQTLEGLGAVAAQLWTAGYSIVTFDARGHGGSGGESALGGTEALDVAAAVSWARRVTPRVIVVGASMGALASLRYAAGAVVLDGLVLVSCPATWRLRSPQAALAAAMTRTWLGRRAVGRMQGVRVSDDWDPGEAPVESAPRVRCPTAIVHGRRDRFIPVSEALRLHGALACPRRLDIVAGAGHAFQAVLATPIAAAAAWSLEARRGDGRAKLRDGRGRTDRRGEARDVDGEVGHRAE